MMSKNILRTICECRICGSKNLILILSLGELYVSDFLHESEGREMRRAPLELVLCNKSNGGCGLLQLRHTLSQEILYRNYWYRSGINQTMIDELNDIVQRTESIASLKEGDFVLDIGSNDSTLLRAYKTPGLNLIGFEPARNIVEKYGREGVNKVFTDFFNYQVWHKEFGDNQAKVITAIAMFYDLDDPNAFLVDVVSCLHKEGLFIIQMSYLPSLLERNAFDGICHEHLEYYSLTSLENLLKRHNLEVFDVELRDINEGSARFYIKQKDGGKTLKIGLETQTRVETMRQLERGLGLHDRKVYEDFVKRIHSIKDKVYNFIKSEVEKGKKVYVYGASTKGNTLLQYFGLDNNLITAAADRNPDKWGKKTVGTLIPIISEQEARAQKPDYFLILPWHFLKEFREREKEYLKSGGKFIVPLPEFIIIEDYI